MKAFSTVFFKALIVLFVAARGGLALAGAAGQASAAQNEDLMIINTGGSDCQRQSMCMKFNKYTIKSSLMIRQLLVQNNVPLRNRPQ